MPSNVSLFNIYKDSGKATTPLPVGVASQQNASLTQINNLIPPISRSALSASMVIRANNGNLSGEILYGGSPTLTNVSLNSLGGEYPSNNGQLPFCAWKYVPTGYAASNGVEGAQPFDCIDHLVQGTNYYGVRQLVHGQSVGELSPDSASMGIAFQNSGSVMVSSGDFAGAMYFQQSQASYAMTDNTDENGRTYGTNKAFRMPKTTTSGERAVHCFWIRTPESADFEDPVAIYTTNGNGSFPTNKAFVNGGFCFYIDTDRYVNVQRFDGTNGVSSCFNMRSPSQLVLDKWHFFAFQVSNNSNTVSQSTNYVYQYSFVGRGFTHTQGGTSTQSARSSTVAYNEGGHLVYNPMFSSGWLSNSILLPTGFQIGHHYIFTVDSSGGGSDLESGDIVNMVGVLNSGSQYTS